ncbi:MAG TPA: hypothetical protein VEB42_00460, partial [Chitinophagaceae bacterium]|nr:hypothetical protein [Chitinophagaceae bacterium]
IFGCVLIAAGGVLLLYVAGLVYQILNNPGEVTIVQYILENVKKDDLALFGTFKDPNDETKDIKFDVHWSDSVRLMCFLFIGAITVNILARILYILISSGTTLMKLGAGSYAINKSKIKNNEDTV